jgi:hypothetical protein
MNLRLPTILFVSIFCQLAYGQAEQKNGLFPFWKVTGNDGTVDGTNFIGTTDLIPFNIRANNEKAGRVDFAGNSFYGYKAGESNISGVGNIAIGRTPARYSTNADYVIAIGDSTGYNNIISDNIFIGAKAGYNNMSGTNITALGTQALYRNFSGIRNTAIGYNSLWGNTAGQDNTAVGSESLWFNTIGVGNSALGSLALYGNISGTGNTAMGAFSLYSNFNTGSNTAVGYTSMYTNKGSENTSIGAYALYGDPGAIGIRNTAIGSNAFFNNREGNDNIVVGAYAMSFNPNDGDDNVVVGNYAGYYNTANQNVFVGSHAGYGNTTAFANVFMGYESGYGNSTPGSVYNTFVGYRSGKANTSLANTFIGAEAGLLNNTGSSNVFIGAFAGRQNAAGFNNTFMGESAGNANTGGANNTYIGHFAGFNNSGNRNTFLGHNTGWSALTSSGTINIGDNAGATNGGSYNIHIGINAGISNSSSNQSYNNVFIGDSSAATITSGAYNTGNGHLSFLSLTGGTYNSVDGYRALPNVTSGNNNVAIGAFAGQNITTFSGNTFVGYGAYPFANVSNYMALGFNSGGISSVNNRVEVGNTSVSFIGGQVGWSTYSDGRIKDNVKQDVKGLDFIMKLNPVTYNLNIYKQSALIPGYAERDTINWEGKYDIEKIKMSGFIAQEVEQAAKASNYDFSGLNKPATSTDLYSLKYAEFVVPLVKAVQEQQGQIEELKKQNALLTKKIEELEHR